MNAPLLRRLHKAAVPDRGSAIVEFTTLAVLLLLPLVYVILTVFKVQAASYGVAQAAREAGRAYVTSDDGVDPRTRAYAAASIAMADHDPTFTLQPSDVWVGGCTATPCLTPGAAIRFEVTYSVSLPFVPHRVFGVTPAYVPVRASHVEFVDRFRGG